MVCQGQNLIMIGCYGNTLATPVASPTGSESPCLIYLSFLFLSIIYSFGDGIRCYFAVEQDDRVAIYETVRPSTFLTTWATRDADRDEVLKNVCVLEGNG